MNCNNLKFYIRNLRLACNNNDNECTGVQNPHRYMHAYSMAHSVHVQYQQSGVRSIELHTLHLNRVLVHGILHILHLNRVLILESVHDLRVGGRHLAMSLYKLKASVTHFNNY